MFKKIISEPLLHFILIGAAIFVAYNLSVDPVEEDDARIYLSANDLSALSNAWETRWNRAPTDQELRGLVDAHVREQVMYREAVRLGLDKDDSIVRRRLAQKLDFLFRDLTDQIEPTESDLEQFLAENPDLFEQPARYSLMHIYFNPDKRGATISADAEKLLSRLRTAESTGVDPSSEGDRFMLQQTLTGYTLGEVSRLMGATFADAVEGITPGEWQGPVNSGYGLHLVYVSEITASRMPTLDEIHEKVEIEYVSQKQRIANEAFYRDLLGDYEVIIDWPTGADADAAGTSGH